MRILVEPSDIIVVVEFRRQNIVNGLVVRIGFGSDIADRLVEQDQGRLFLHFLDSLVNGEIRRFDVKRITCIHFLGIGADGFPVYGDRSLLHQGDKGPSRNLMTCLDVGDETHTLLHYKN
jgi:hypothetical protein